MCSAYVNRQQKPSKKYNKIKNFHHHIFVPVLEDQKEINPSSISGRSFLRRSLDDLILTCVHLLLCFEVGLALRRGCVDFCPPTVCAALPWDWWLCTSQTQPSRCTYRSSLQRLPPYRSSSSPAPCNCSQELDWLCSLHTC